MKKLLIATAAIAALTAVPAAAQSTAASANPKATASARLIKPLTLTKLGDLNFGTIVMGQMTANQTVAINTAGTVSCGASGGGLTCTGSPTAAGFRITGTQGQIVKVTAPAITLTGSNGGTLTFTPTPTADITLGNSGAQGNDFAVGGNIVVATNQQDGVYSGELEVTVDY